MKTIPAIVVALGALLLAGCSSTKPTSAVSAGDPTRLVNKDSSGVALQGYDPVAYFTDNKPVKGSRKYESAYRGAIYQFASAEHKAMFDQNPAKYEPQFGGYCGYAASINKVSPIMVEYFQILDGRLVLQHNDRAWRLWNEDVKGNLVKADQNWSELEQKYGN